MKRIITSGSKKEVAKLEKENKEQKKERDSKELKKVPKKENVAENTEKDPKEYRRLSNTFNFDLNQLWPHIPSMTCKSGKDFDEDPEEDDDLGGSIFDLVESPVKDISTIVNNADEGETRSDEGRRRRDEGATRADEGETNEREVER